MRRSLKREATGLAPWYAKEQSKKIGGKMTEKQQARLLARIALQKLADIEKGHSLRLLLWPDGSTGIVMGAGYAGEQDGDDPLVILRREDYEDIDPDDPDDIDLLAEKIEDALLEKEKNDK